MRYRIFCALLLVWFASSCGRTKPVEAWWVDSLVKVFPDDSVGSHALREPAFAAARRANLSLQLALRSPLGIGDLYVDALPLSGPGMPIDRIEVRRVEYVVATTNTPGASRNAVLRKAPAWFPDALVAGFPMTVEKNRTRAVWITVSVAADQPIGHYAGVLRLRQGLEELIRLPYTLDVTGAAVPAEIPFEVSHRFILNDAYSQQFYRTARFSGQWWTMAGNVSRFLAGYHQTSIPADPMDLVVAGASGGEMRYDFSSYIRFVRLFESAGVRGFLDGGQLLGRGARAGDPLTMRIWAVEEGRAVERRVGIDDARVPPFLAGFHGSLRRALAEQGWENRYAQGLLDAPGAREAQECARMEAQIRRLMPGARTVDARPRGRQTGAFLDQPLIEKRILGWVDFQQGLRGRLRWEGNRWSPDPFKDTQPVVDGESGFPPPGAAHLTYPNREGRTFHSSIRLEQMRESIEDYALLMELSRKDPAKARDLSTRMAGPATGQVREPAAFRPILRELLDSF
jgi:hypothetical protein